MIVRKKIHWKLTICEYKKIGVFGGIMYLMVIHSIKQGQMSNVNNFTTFSIEWKLHGFQLFKVP
jgi:ABC-type phosphate transport system permease subunit